MLTMRATPVGTRGAIRQRLHQFEIGASLSEIVAQCEQQIALARRLLEASGHELQGFTITMHVGGESVERLTGSFALTAYAPKADG